MIDLVLRATMDASASSPFSYCITSFLLGKLLALSG
jgi:hypothetical protein